ncbi:MAG: hypothetical protein Q7U56_10645 [Humidesulfovibrio sp.]|nr:hypothetical protein [Humidesulfovibrio sp.]
MSKGLNRRIHALEAKEAAKPLIHPLVMYMTHDPQVVYVNGVAVHRLEGENTKDFKDRVLALCPKSKNFISLITTIPPKADGEADELEAE